MDKSHQVRSADQIWAKTNNIWRNYKQNSEQCKYYQSRSKQWDNRTIERDRNFSKIVSRHPQVNFRKSQQKLDRTKHFSRFYPEKSYRGGHIGPPPRLGRVNTLTAKGFAKNRKKCDKNERISNVIGIERVHPAWDF